MMHFTPDPGWHNDPRDGDADSRHDNGTYAAAKFDFAVIGALQQGHSYTSVISHHSGLTHQAVRKALNALKDAGVVKRTETLPYEWTLT